MCVLGQVNILGFSFAIKPFHGLINNLFFSISEIKTKLATITNFVKIFSVLCFCVDLVQTF